MKRIFVISLFGVLLGIGGCTTAVAALFTPGGSALLDGHFVVPVRGTITQPFGCTSLSIEPASNSCSSGHWHSGVDIATALGTPIHATLGGTVSVINSAIGYGLHIVIDHGDGVTSLYGHLSAAAIPDGTTVGTDDVIGAVGSTGNSTGPHLHFEIRRNGVAEDPQIDIDLSHPPTTEENSHG